MLTRTTGSSMSASVARMRRPDAARGFGYRSRALTCTMACARRGRERVLACLAFIMLIAAWDATLRLDEHVAPPRLRLSHAVELEHEGQRVTKSEENSRTR